MARAEADLTKFILASDYDPAHYKWTEKELAALGDCKATAEVIKNRLEDNGAKVKEMYAIEHRGEAKAAKGFHNNVDEAQKHYHILVYFEPSHGATLKEIAKFIGVPPEVIEKPERGRYGYPNCLSYLTHIKYEDKIQYPPEDVVTLAGTDYMDYYNANKERWIKARHIVKQNGGKTLKNLYQEAIKKLKNGELTYDEIARTQKYREVFLTPKWRRELKGISEGVIEIVTECEIELGEKIRNKEITSVDMIISNKNYALAYKYRKDSIDSLLRRYANNPKRGSSCHSIQEG